MKLRETWKHILSKQYKNRVGRAWGDREKEGRGAAGGRRWFQAGCSHAFSLSTAQPTS